MDALSCRRHPDTETYLRCSACETPICPACWVEAVVGYQCPDCASARGTSIPDRDAKPKVFGGALAGGGGSRPAGERLSPTLAARAGLVGLAAAVVGGMLLGPVLSQGTLFLLSSGAIGWGVARAVFWAAEEEATPFVRATAMTFAGFTAAVGMVASGSATAEPGILFLAYPAAMYGGWIAVRRR
ncbi:B-box zinc finger protein [Nitriliruptor alkaliphilus]|uniref:B-box zinc finger protein n=1 Tax=Nitriliruptor alkaliphilus TaxID=427918 RepID=UPI000696F2A0|nr:B-box zinc finger protein [Nitriliruptor alkaliphilus]